MKKISKYLAEFVGTFFLVLVVSLSISGNSTVPTLLLAVSTVGIFVYTVGHLSGAHFNPAITLGALSIRKISVKDAVIYWVAQFLAAGAACLVATQLVDFNLNTPLDNNPMTYIGEAIGAFLFAFGVAAEIYGRVPKDVSGVAVAVSLMLGISVASHFGNGILNPAVAFGINSFSPAYLVGPLVGAVLGMWAYKLVSEKR